MMMTKFINKWDGRRLEDWGCAVSKEYKSFQQDMRREVARMAQAEGARLVDFSSGHYGQSGFLERDGLYVYFSYSNIDRCHVQLTGGRAFMMRTAKNAKDYSGGQCNNVPFSGFSETLKRLFREQACQRLSDGNGVYLLEHVSSHGFKFELVQFDWGVHVRVTLPDGTLLYHNEMWPGSFSKSYDIYENTRRQIMDESSNVYVMLSKQQKQTKKAA